MLNACLFPRKAATIPPGRESSYRFIEICWRSWADIRPCSLTVVNGHPPAIAGEFPERSGDAVTAVNFKACLIETR